MALTKITGEGLGSLGTGNLTHGSDSGDTRFTLNSANQYTLVLKNAGNIAGQIGGSGSDVLRFSNAAGATIMEMNAGQITKPLQPAFLATITTQQNNIATGQFTTINFDNEIYDQNADFNTSTKTFTAPVTGRYMLSTNMYFLNVDIDPSYIQLELITSNRVYFHVLSPKFSQDMPYYTTNISICADMDASDTAYVRVYQAGGTAQMDVSESSYFSGFLVA